MWISSTTRKPIYLASCHRPSWTHPSPMNNHPPNEETPLLAESAHRKATPLPKFQIAIVLLLQLCEPITSLSIYPYVNQVLILSVFTSLRMAHPFSSWSASLTLPVVTRRKSAITRGWLFVLVFARSNWLNQNSCRQESLFYVTEAMTVLQWSRMSDHIGRKPVLLIGIFGTMLSMLSFGLSRSFLALVVRYAYVAASTSRTTQVYTTHTAGVWLDY